MKNVIILHGMPSQVEYENPANKKPTESHWLPWIQERLIKKGFDAKIPALPLPYAPEYKSWCEVFEQLPLNEETVLIGHSCGAGFLVRYLSEHPTVHISLLVLVAPWIDTKHELTNGFFDFTIDTQISNRIKNGIVLFTSSDDEETLESVRKLEDNINDIEIKHYTDQGHFTEEDMGTTIFPDLLETILTHTATLQ